MPILDHLCEQNEVPEDVNLSATGSLEYSPAELDSLIIGDERIYEHKTICINYTTYDLRQEQDTINPRSRADIIVLS